VSADLAAFITLTFFLVVTPGATTAVIVDRTLAGGRAGGLAAALGAAVGNSTHAAAAGLGVAWLLARSPVALDVIRIGGAAFLAWLGIRTLLGVARARWRMPRRGGRPDEPHAASTSAVAAFRAGVLVNLLNPPIIVFYLSIVPGFVPAGATWRYTLLLSAIHVTMAFALHVVWAVAFGRLRRWVATPGRLGALSTLTGLALVALAIRVWWR
jgi:threonine/homoserine/homoserine lactone efflux protein